MNEIQKLWLQYLDEKRIETWILEATDHDRLKRTADAEHKIIYPMAKSMVYFEGDG